MSGANSWWVPQQTSGPLRKRRLLKNAGWMLFDRVFRLLISVFVGAWVARHLGPVGYGQLSYILSLLVLFQSVCMLGLDGPVVREISQDRPKSGVVLGSALWMSVAGGAAGWAAAALCVAMLRPEDPEALGMMLIAGAALAFQPARIVDLWLQSESQSKISIPSKTLAYAVAAAIKITLILSDGPIWAFAAVAAVEAMLVALALSWSYRLWPSPTSWTWRRSRAKELLEESWPFLLAACSIAIYMRIDQIMLRELAGEIELGYYSAVVPISQAWHIIPVAFTASALGYLSRLYREDRPLYEARLQQVYIVMMWASLIGTAAIVALAPIVVRLLLGAQYLPAIEVLQWHAVSNVFVALGVGQNMAVVIERAPRLAFYKAITGAVASVAGNMLLIPTWGALGAAWASVAAYMASSVLSNIVVSPRAFRMQVRAIIPVYRARNSSNGAPL